MHFVGFLNHSQACIFHLLDKIYLIKSSTSDEKKEWEITQTLDLGFYPTKVFFKNEYLLVSYAKYLSIYKFKDSEQIFEKKSKFEFPKTITDIEVSGTLNSVLVADKFGDVWMKSLLDADTFTGIKLEDDKEQVDQDQDEEDSQPKKEKVDLKCKLMLGHTSLLTCLKLNEDETFLWTADRDERIRCSHFPETHLIEDFYLAHSKFITSLEIISPNVFVSAGGDNYVVIWNLHDYQKYVKLDLIKDSDKPVKRIIPGADGSSFYVIFEDSSDVIRFTKLNNQYVSKMFSVKGPIVDLSFILNAPVVLSLSAEEPCCILDDSGSDFEVINLAKVITSLVLSMQSSFDEIENQTFKLRNLEKKVMKIDARTLKRRKVLEESNKEATH